MEAKVTGCGNVYVGNNSRSSFVGGDASSHHNRWRGLLDKPGITKGVCRYNSAAGFAVATEPYPRGEDFMPAETEGLIPVLS